MIVGDGGENEIPLMKHGSEKRGNCYQWELLEGDYIREIIYTYSHFTNSVIEIFFESHEGQRRVVGRG